MKKLNIPQEENKTTNGIKKVMYAPNDDGKFEKYKYGSSVEEYATELAVKEYELLKEESLKNIKEGLSSPIEYYMYENRMDLPTLASVTGFFQFRVKRHLKAKNFKKLNDKILNKYALVFGVTLEELKDFSYEK